MNKKGPLRKWLWSVVQQQQQQQNSIKAAYRFKMAEVHGWPPGSVVDRKLRQILN